MDYKDQHTLVMIRIVPKRSSFNKNKSSNWNCPSPCLDYCDQIKTNDNDDDDDDDDCDDNGDNNNDNNNIDDDDKPKIWFNCYYPYDTVLQVSTTRFITQTLQVSI